MSNNERYKTFGPLPGGWESYLETLRIILSKIREGGLTLDELSYWVSEKFKSEPKWTKNALRICIVHTSLARVEEGLLYLTEDGNKFLDTGDKGVILNCLYKNIWGVREMLQWLMERQMASRELLKKFKSIGASWGKDYQVRYRLLWLRALGIVDKSGEEYYLTNEGKRVVKSLEVTPPLETRREALPGGRRKPSHDDIVNMISKLGELFGFYVKREEWTPDKAYRCDITWRDYETHAPLKVFEVELSGNIDHALSSLAHAHDTWRSDLYLVVVDEEDAERARKLVEPRVRGAFARIANKLRIISWTDINTILECLKLKESLVKDLTKR